MDKISYEILVDALPREDKEELARLVNLHTSIDMKYSKIHSVKVRKNYIDFYVGKDRILIVRREDKENDMDTM